MSSLNLWQVPWTLKCEPRKILAQNWSITMHKRVNYLTRSTRFTCCHPIPCNQCDGDVPPQISLHNYCTHFNGPISLVDRIWPLKVYCDSYKRVVRNYAVYTLGSGCYLFKSDLCKAQLTEALAWKVAQLGSLIEGFNLLEVSKFFAC